MTHLETAPTLQLKVLLDGLDTRDDSLENFKTFKASAMILAKNGADLRVKNTLLLTLLHILVTTNKGGSNEREIIELIKINQTLVNIGAKHSPLATLIDCFDDGECTLDDFKRTALFLAHNGADLETKALRTSNTLLHSLVRTNKGGVNTAELEELFKLKPDIVNVKGFRYQTPLKCLINQLDNVGCSLTDFKATALLLAQNGAHLDVSHHSLHTLLHILVTTNQEGRNDKELALLVKLHPNLVNIGNNYPPLSALIDDEKCTPDDFKKTALFLAHNGADLRVKGFKRSNTLLHILVLTNKSGVNTAEIEALFRLDKTLVNVPGLLNETPLKCLINQFNNKKCSLEDFKQTAMLLTRLGADLEVKDKKSHTLIQHLMLLNKDGCNDPEIAELLKLNKNILAIELYNAIQKMHDYGLALKTKGAAKNQVAIDLSIKLKLEADKLFENDEDAPRFSDFQKSFAAILSSKNKEMSKYRANWNTIIANIAIALTGIGALFIAAKIIHSKITEGRALFFFQKSKTTGEENIEAAKHSVIM